uniref:Reverse transcriptase domain-containing protein n=1 Tax=Tanacetum cinerariifolium TaxID=118510 RepID=A0A699IBA1_TANCI|nr:hypothetical protein [Tanacetum cinerariifolium]
MSGEDPLQNPTPEVTGNPSEPEIEPTPVAHEAGGPSNMLLEQDTEDPIMQFVIHNFNPMNAMYKAFTQKLKSTPLHMGTDPPVIEPWNSDSDDVPARARENIFVKSDNVGPPKSRATTRPTPLTDAVKGRQAVNNDFSHEPFIFKESDRDVGAARFWYDNLTPESIDGFHQLRDKFQANFLQQRRFQKTQAEILGAFISGMRPGRLFKDLIAKPPKSLKDLFTQTNNFIRAEEANNENSLREPCRETKQHMTYKDLLRRNRDKHVSRSANRHNESHRFSREAFTALVKSPAEILATSEGKSVLRPPPRMFTPTSKRDRTKYCEFHEDHGHETNDCIDLRKEIEACIRKGRIAHLARGAKTHNNSQNTQACRSHTDPHKLCRWRKHAEIMYEHCFEQLPAEEKKAIRPPTTLLVGFSGHVSWPLGLVTLPITLYDYRSHTSKTIMVEFMIVRSPSPYNIILGRSRLRQLGAVASTLHALIKFQPQAGVAIIKDAYKGYHQIRMAREEEEKTSFHTEQGTFCYEKMPLGLKNAGATYQRLMDNMFQGQLGRNIEIYVDDMVIKINNEGSLITDITETFDTLREANMKLNPKKCTFGVETGRFLGYMITNEEIQENPKKVQAIIDMVSTRILREVQVLNGNLEALGRFLAKSAK